MKKRTFWKFLIIYLLCAFLSFLSSSFICSLLSEKYLIETTAENLYSEVSRMASGRVGTSYLKSDVSSEDIYENLCALASYQSAIFWLINCSGDILIDTSASSVSGSMRKIINFDPSELPSRYYQIGDFFGMFHEKTLSVVSPITDKFTTRGYFCAHFNLKNLKHEKDAIMNIFRLAFCIILLIFSLLVILFYRRFYHPLARIKKAAEEYASGNLNYKIYPDMKDEFCSLSASLRYLASEIKQSGDYQKKFISNISHDFRSPLTSIKGYLEAMLDGTIPYESQDHYLHIVLSEAERLSKLTNSLLTLATYDEQKVLLELSDFDINDVIRQTTATFEVLCLQKNLRVDLFFDQGPLYVSADLGKIQQVLYNLLDNAIKFSNPDSSIRIETTEVHDKVFVSVKDHGEGIASENLSKIWTRFYKTDPSRGKDKKGTGLGLAITKEIIQSHGEYIDVISTPNVGTEFTFSLQCAHPESS